MTINPGSSPRAVSETAAEQTSAEKLSAEPVQSSRASRRVWLVAGFACVGLGGAGAVLPLLPTTPFLLLAAACFARGDPRFLEWLLKHRVFGPTLKAWRDRRALPVGVKSKAIVLVVVTLGISAWVLDSLFGRIALVLVGACLIAFLARLPVWKDGEGSPE